MRKPRLVIGAVLLALVPLVWAGTIAPPAQPTHSHDSSGHDDSGKGKVVARIAISVPVAEAHSAILMDDVRSGARHVLLIVQLRMTTGLHYSHAECFAQNDGGSHDHSHRITACHFRNQSGSVIKRGSCDTPGGYGPCGFSGSSQHWHSPTISTGGLTGPWQAVGGFDVSGHSHATHATGFFQPPN
jgi:hypothetical protein